MLLIGYFQEDAIIKKEYGMSIFLKAVVCEVKSAAIF